MPAVVGALIAGGIAAGASFATQAAIGASIAVATKAAVAAFGVTFLAKLTAAGGQRAAVSQTEQIIRSSSLPARWILGRAKVGGQLVFYHEANTGGYDRDTPRPHLVNLAIILSEGQLTEIEKIWIDGEPINVLGRVAEDGGFKLTLDNEWAGNVEVWEYFSADGSGGGSLVRSSAITEVSGGEGGEGGGEIDDPELIDDSVETTTRNLWTTDHRLNGKSWVHIKLIQNDHKNDPEDRLFDRFPEINFLVKGLKLTWPGQSTPTWSESAAAIRYWWLTERCAISPDKIDRESFDVAHQVCSDQITYSLTSSYSNYEPVSLRYSVNGVITAEDDPDTINQELDFCWQGYVVEADSKLYFRPGVNRPIIGTLTERDIIQVNSIRTAPVLQERINAMSMSIAQSRVKEWQQQDVPRQRDEQAILNRDNNQELWTNIGVRRFVNDPLIAGRLLRISLRRVQSLASYTYTVKPGQFLQWLSIIPADSIRIENPSLGISEDAFVVGVTTNPDWSVTLTLQPQDSEAYTTPNLSEILPGVSGGGVPKIIGLDHTDVHSDHTDSVSTTAIEHGDDHTDTTEDHQDDHADSPPFKHVDGHLDQNLGIPGHADAHTDVIHVDDHTDTTAPSSHQNVHTDTNHGDTDHDDTHADETHVDSHDDRSHGDRNAEHFDQHLDISHQDTHTDDHDDRSHGDRNAEHFDQHLDISHQDTHTDDHDDRSHGDRNAEHFDQHLDISHQDTHTDDHIDDHDDKPHGDRAVKHFDQHLDVSHQDTHDDDHNNITHINVPGSHSDDHNDITHLDSHNDTPHGDSHADRPHNDRQISSAAHLDTHADNHTDEPSGEGDDPGQHDDTHTDRPYTDVHGDDPRINIHSDTPHVNSHTDRGSSGSHTDRTIPHQDRRHTDTHSNTHTDTPMHGDSHANTHVDEPLGESDTGSHTDHHTDTSDFTYMKP